MAKNDEKIKALLERAEQETREVFESENYRNYLATMSKFHSYSYRNCLLIAMQRPDATHVAGYTAWQKKFKRQVQRGEKGIQIIGYTPKNITVEQEKQDSNGKTIIGADGKPVMEKVTKQIPSFMPVYVYDVSQTEGEPLPEFIHDLDGSVEAYQELMDAIISVSPFPVTFENFPGEARGYCDPVAQKIVIREGMSESQSVKTAIHEITHADLHAPEINIAMNDRTDRRTKEVEAESTAFVVCSHYGIDTSDYTFPYLASWSSTKELKELQSSLEKIQKQAGDLIDRIDARLDEMQKERENSLFKEVTPEELQSVIAAFENKEDRPRTCYLANENGQWTALDDRSLDCWVETFPDRKTAIAWLNNEIEISSPDKNITPEEVKEYGFDNADSKMLPLDADKAKELFSAGATIHALYSDSSYATIQNDLMLDSHLEKDGLFGIKSGDWSQMQRLDAVARDLAIRLDSIAQDLGVKDYPYIQPEDQRTEVIQNFIKKLDYGTLVNSVDSALPKDDAEKDVLSKQLDQLKIELDKFSQEQLSFELNKFGGEPVVVVKWSENPALSSGQIFPLHEANKVFEKLDMTYPEDSGYDKTAFILKYKMDGQYFTYEGRQDFGDREGTLINHIRNFWEYELKEERQAIHAAYGNTSIIAHAKEALERFVPYLSFHANLGEIEAPTRKNLRELISILDSVANFPGSDQLKQYYIDVLSYVSDARTALNNGTELPNMPDRSAYSLSEQQFIISPQEQAENEAYKKQVEKEIAIEAKAAGITPDQYVAAGSVAPANRTFTIYQLNDSPAAREIRFMGTEYLEQKNITPTLDLYNKVYSGVLPEGKGLDEIFAEFNMNHPADFTGHSLSVSDVVAIEYQGSITANYVDSFGFKNYPDLASEIQKSIEQNRQHEEILESVIHDNDIDLDREKTPEQLGFKAQPDQTPEQPKKRMSMKDRLAAAKVEADKRNAALPGKVNERERGDKNVQH